MSRGMACCNSMGATQLERSNPPSKGWHPQTEQQHSSRSVRLFEFQVAPISQPARRNSEEELPGMQQQVHGCISWGSALRAAVAAAAAAAAVLLLRCLHACQLLGCESSRLHLGSCLCIDLQLPNLH